MAHSATPVCPGEFLDSVEILSKVQDTWKGAHWISVSAMPAPMIWPCLTTPSWTCEVLVFGGLKIHNGKVMCCEYESCTSYDVKGDTWLEFPGALSTDGDLHVVEPHVLAGDAMALVLSQRQVRVITMPAAGY